MEGEGRGRGVDGQGRGDGQDAGVPGGEGGGVMSGDGHHSRHPRHRQNRGQARHGGVEGVQVAGEAGSAGCLNKSMQTNPGGRSTGTRRTGRSSSCQRRRETGLPHISRFSRAESKTWFAFIHIYSYISSMRLKSKFYCTIV